MPIVRDVLFFVLWIGLPIAAFVPRLKKPEDIGKRMVIGVLGTWFALVLHHEFIGHPVAMALAKERGHLGYDGIAMNAFVHLFGWAFGLFSTAGVATLYTAIQAIRKKRQAT